jgi:Tfp pilus assembly protein PilV
MHPPGAQFKPPTRGLTLIEVMMATTVTLVAVVGLISAVTIGAEMLDVSRKQTVAMQILRNEVDHVHLKSWAAVAALPATASITINSDGTGLSAGGAADQQAFALTNYTSSTLADDNVNLMREAKGFTCSLVKAPVPLKANLFQLTYTISWTSGNRLKTYTRKSSTYYGKSGLNVYYQR